MVLLGIVLTIRSNYAANRFIVGATSVYAVRQSDRVYLLRNPEPVSQKLLGKRQASGRQYSHTRIVVNLLTASDNLSGTRC